MVSSGAYEPPKATKEHETQLHHNPNYVMFLNKFLQLSCTISIQCRLMRFYLPYIWKLSLMNLDFDGTRQAM